jgi:hypothetical protein
MGKNSKATHSPNAKVNLLKMRRIVPAKVKKVIMRNFWIHHLFLTLLGRYLSCMSATFSKAL